MLRALAILLASLSWCGCQSQRPPFDPFLGDQRIPPPGTGTGLPPLSSTPYYQGPPPPGIPPGGLNQGVPPAGSYPQPGPSTVPGGSWQAPGQSALPGTTRDLSAASKLPASAAERVQVPVDGRPIRQALQVRPSRGDLAQAESPVTGLPQSAVAQLGPPPAATPTYVAPFGPANLPTSVAEHSVIYGAPTFVASGLPCCPAPHIVVDPCCNAVAFVAPPNCGPELALREITDLPSSEGTFAR